MELNNEILDLFIFCKYRAYLRKNGHIGIESDYELIEKKLSTIYKDNFLAHIRQSYHPSQIGHSLFPKNAEGTPSIIIDAEIKGDGFSTTFDCIEITRSRTKGRPFNYTPVALKPKEQINNIDRLSLTLKSLLLKRLIHILPGNGKIIHGMKFKSTPLKFHKYERKSHKILAELEALITDNRKPSVFRNDNCSICEFRETCRKHLIEKDDLSLLGGFRPAEIMKRNNRGIFTINQLSYNFRPKKFQRMPEKIRPFSFELKALSIRDKKTYILEVPMEFKASRIEIYLDFESLPDENFVYLIGLIINIDNISQEKISFWADSKSEEKEIFERFLDVMSRFDTFVVYHYGAFEPRELRRASKTYSGLNQPIIAKILASSVNLLSYFYSKVYVPTYTNELKDIGRFLGFHWSIQDASGILSIAWRKMWELTPNEGNKAKIVQYNIEDCQCLEKVKHWLENKIIGQQENNDDFGSIAKLKTPIQLPYSFGEGNYLLPDFAEINKFAYFGYQRNRIFLKTNNSIRRAIKRTIRKRKLVNRPDKIIDIFPERCPVCRTTGHFEKLRSSARQTIDLRFLKCGLRKFVIKFNGGGFRCVKCHKTFTPKSYKQTPYYGNNLIIWTVNQHVQYRVSYEQLIDMIAGQFKVQVSLTRMSMFKSMLARRYTETYEEIKASITAGPLINVDETKVNICGLPSGYIWVLTNCDTVLYLFTTSRECDFLRHLLKEFKGVLISDFYTGYDSIDCTQQKCLVHLIRDLNKEFLNNQLDEEFKGIVVNFGKLQEISCLL